MCVGYWLADRRRVAELLLNLIVSPLNFLLS